MGLTLTEKILKAHLVEGEMVKGSEIGIRIDQTLTQDATGLKMQMTTVLSAALQRNTASTSPVPATVSATRYIWSVSAFRERP